MPPNWNAKAGFDSVYYRPAEGSRPAGRPRVVVNYCRWAVYPEAQQYADFYTTITSPTNSIVVIGSGFAWSLEILVDQYGYDPALLTGIDTSTYIQGAKATKEWLQAVRVPADEEFTTLLEKQAASILQFALGRVGGILEAQAIRHRLSS